MGAFILDDNFGPFVRELLERDNAPKVAASVGIPETQLGRWASGHNHYSPSDEFALYGYSVRRQHFDLLGRYAAFIPPYDKQAPFSFETKPLGAELPVPSIELINRPVSLAGKKVNFPLGVAASVLTRNSDAIAYYAKRGFDILTYKTVRSRSWEALPPPTWAFVVDDAIDGSTRLVDQAATLKADLDYWPRDPTRASMANSFGIPSLAPDDWRADVERAKSVIGPGQVLIVSVVASDSESHEAIIGDFVTVAKMAKAAGADIIEANYSCPNTPGSHAGDLYEDPELARRVTLAIKEAIAPTPLFIKIGYLAPHDLEAFVKANRDADGIVAINALLRRVISPTGEQFFPGHERSAGGISGSIIRPLGLEVVANLAKLRADLGCGFAIVGVGGVSTPAHVVDYLNAGADAVESVTAAYLNPNFRHLDIERRY